MVLFEAATSLLETCGFLQIPKVGKNCMHADGHYSSVWRAKDRESPKFISTGLAE